MQWNVRDSKPNLRQKSFLIFKLSKVCRTPKHEGCPCDKIFDIIRKGATPGPFVIREWMKVVKKALNGFLSDSLRMMDRSPLWSSIRDKGRLGANRETAKENLDQLLDEDRHLIEIDKHQLITYVDAEIRREGLMLKIATRVRYAERALIDELRLEFEERMVKVTGYRMPKPETEKPEPTATTTATTTADQPPQDDWNKVTEKRARGKKPYRKGEKPYGELNNKMT